MSSDIMQLISLSKNLKVLYVEDNLEARESTLLMFENFFDHPSIAVDGLDGLNQYMEHYEKHNSYFDLLISDINMPKMDGAELGKLVFKQNPSQLIMILSAHDDSQKLQDLLDMGISHFLQKPVKLEAFIETLAGISEKFKDIS